MEDILSYLIPSGSILLVIAVLIKICQFCSGTQPVFNIFIVFFFKSTTSGTELSICIITDEK